jgi:BirA family biotin operon repressor/biotin-[acetyl-CoA-carboxylase] ligase
LSSIGASSCAAEREDAVRASNACHTARVFADEMRRPIDVGDLRARLLAGASSWHTIDLVAETGSTNADLIARAVGGEDVDGEVLIAEHQTAGRGRNGRSWSGVPGAQITMSVGVNADGIPPAAWGWLPLVAGLSVLNAVDGSGVRVGLKWPNDVLASPPAEGKVAGILAEVASPKPMVVIGIGMNVSLNANELPDPRATSLAMLGGRATNREDLILDLLNGLARHVAGLRSTHGAGAGLIAEYTARSLTIGSRVRATLPGDRQVVGEALSIDEQGRLRIDTGSEVVVVSAGDIVHLRPV